MIVRNDVTENEVFKLASIGCTYEEMADWFKCSKDYLLRNYGNVIKEGHTNIKISLRRKQLQIALDGDRTMLIWLGKQMLNQREPKNIELIPETSPDGLSFKVVSKNTDYESNDNDDEEEDSNV